jgi:hypothetical protein
VCGHSQHCGAHALSALHRRRLRRSHHRSLCASSRARVEAGSVCLCVCMCAQRVEAASGGSLRAFMHACECSHVRACSCSYAVRACSLVCARNRCAPSRFIRHASRMRWLWDWQLHCALVILANLLRDPEGASASALTALRRISLFRLHLSPSPLSSACGRAPPASHTQRGPPTRLSRDHTTRRSQDGRARAHSRA